MILVGNQRGGAKNLALHLMKDENERVQVHQIRGFMSDDLESAFRESYAMSRATKCKQHLFSLSLNPPNDAELSAEKFEQTVDRAEETLGLSGQPRAIVLHTKNGRTHAHAVWSRIDAVEMRAVQMSFSKNKMQELSRELYHEHGWTMPRGFVRHEESDPRNYSLAEWQQCKRSKRDPTKTKEIFQDAWAISDSRQAFASALQSHGFVLAKGDRRGHIAVDHNGEAFAISRYVGIKAKQVRDRLGKPDDLPSQNDAHKVAADRVAARLGELQEQQRRNSTERLQLFFQQAEQQRLRHTSERISLVERQAQQRQEMDELQQARIRKGFLGFVDRLTGKRQRTIEQNYQETLHAEKEAAAERQLLTQSFERRQADIKTQRNEVAARAAYIQRELTKDARQLTEKVPGRSTTNPNTKISQQCSHQSHSSRHRQTPSSLEP
jgi:hypothetical protein